MSKDYYHLRIHYEDSMLKDIVSWIKDNSSLVLIIRELYASRNHVHCVLQMKNVGLSRFRQNLLSAFPALKGNGSYSLKVVRKTIEEMLQYLCKGENSETPPDIVDYGTLDIDAIMSYHIEYWKVNANLMKIEVNTGCQNDPSIPPKKKTKTKTWSEKTFDELMLMEHEIDMIRLYELLTKPTDYEKAEYEKAKRALFGHVMKCLGKAVKKLNDNIIKDLWNGFYNAIIHTDEESSSKYVDKLYARLGI